MEVKKLQEEEILPALHLVWEVFAEDVAPCYTEQGVASFQSFIKYDNILRLFHAGEICLFGAYEGETLCGVIAVRSEGHICLFYVRKDQQKHGIGHMLFQAAYNYCALELRVNRITVNAAPGATPAYQRFGMRQVKEEQAEDGIRFVPMEQNVLSGLVKPVRKKTSKKVIAALVAAGVVCVLLLMVAGVHLIRNVYQQVIQSGQTSEDDGWITLPDDEDGDDDPMDPDSGFGTERGQDDDGTTSDTDNTGINALPCYEADDLSYEIEEETYTYSGDNEKTTQVYFDVAWPKLSGLSGDVSDQINETIKTCAMQSVTEMYESPTEEFKEKILGEATPVLASYVTYRVCYANNRFISIAFSDAGYGGSSSDVFQHLRCVNINLEDGTVYEAKDILDLSDAFISEWKSVMRDEASDQELLSELTDAQIKSTLSGEDIDGNYVVQFLVDADGIEIGYDFNYDQSSTESAVYAWVTAPFDFDRIETYQTDASMWELLDD